MKIVYTSNTISYWF